MWPLTHNQFPTFLLFTSPFPFDPFTVVYCLSLHTVTVILYSALSLLSFSCHLSDIALYSSPTPLCHLNRDADCPQPLIPSTTFHPRRHPLKHHSLNHHQCLAPVKVSTQESPHSSSCFLNLCTFCCSQSTKVLL